MSKEDLEEILSKIIIAQNKLYSTFVPRPIPTGKTVKIHDNKQHHQPQQQKKFVKGGDVKDEGSISIFDDNDFVE
jgi:hypothetical protein